MLDKRHQQNTERKDALRTTILAIILCFFAGSAFAQAAASREVCKKSGGECKVVRVGAKPATGTHVAGPYKTKKRAEEERNRLRKTPKCKKQAADMRPIVQRERKTVALVQRVSAAISRFREVGPHRTLGVESDLAVDLDDDSELLVMPQLHYELSEYLEIQLGAGAEFAVHDKEFSAGFRFIYAR